MLSIQNVLFPTDFSTSSDHSIELTGPLVERFGAKLHVLHLIAWHGQGLFSRLEYGLPETEQKRILDRLRTMAHESLRETFDIEPDNYVQIVQEASSSIVEGIVGYANDHDIDLIIMCKKSGHVIYRHIIGGTVERVVRGSNVPVLVLGETREIDPGFKRILVPVDMSDHSKSLLITADNLADELGAHLDVLHVMSPYDSDVPLSASMDAIPVPTIQNPEEVHKQLDELVDKYVDPDTDVTTHLRSGVVDKEIPAFAREESHDLMLIASHGLTGIPRILGSSARSAIHKSPCPVLIIKSFGKQLVAESREESMTVVA